MALDFPMSVACVGDAVLNNQDTAGQARWIENDRTWEGGSEWEVDNILRQRKNRKTVY